MNAAAWNRLAEHSRALVHHVSLLMGILTHPTLADDDDSRAPVAARVATTARALTAALSIAPEFVAHQRDVLRFETALAAWERSVHVGSPIERRYQTALLQQGAQVLISCLHIEALAVSERARVDAVAFDLSGRQGSHRQVS